MRIRIEIKTPQGQAKATSRKLKPYVLGFRKTQNQVWANKSDDCIIWIVDGEVRDCLAITKNLALYDKLVGTLLSNKLVRRVARLTDEQKVELDKMLHEQTKIRLIQSAEELPDMTDWQAVN